MADLSTAALLSRFNRSAGDVSSFAGGGGHPIERELPGASMALGGSAAGGKGFFGDDWPRACRRGASLSEASVPGPNGGPDNRRSAGGVFADEPLPSPACD